MKWFPLMYTQYIWVNIDSFWAYIQWQGASERRTAALCFG